jgi:hypothetical protein
MTVRRIVTIQAGLREVGRIRMGVQEVAANGKIRPARLDTFRLTSRDETAIRAAADVYGGHVSVWAEAPEQTGPQWQVVITSAFLDVLVPPNGYESSFELWSGGGCQRRCNGQFEELTRGKCLCPADPSERTAMAAEGKACVPTSRLRVLLPRLRSIGAWRLESHGYFAAVELGGMADLLDAAAMSGWTMPARLRIEQRFVKRPGEPRHDFTVPVLEIPDLTPQQVLGSGTSPAPLGLSAGPDLPRSNVDLPHGGSVTVVDGEVREIRDALPGDVIDVVSHGFMLAEAEARGGMTLSEITHLAKVQNVNVALLNAQAKLLEPTGRTLPNVTDAERLDIAHRFLA